MVDKTEKVSSQLYKAYPKKIVIFQDGRLLVVPLTKLRNSTTAVHHFSSQIDLDRSQNLKNGLKNNRLMNFQTILFVLPIQIRQGHLFNTYLL